MASASCLGVIMTALYPHQVDYGNTTNGGLRFGPQFVNLLRMDKTLEQPFQAIGRRLAAIRQAESSMNQREWAEKHGFSVTQYNNWEKGVRRITVDEAERLCDLYGLKLDFIYRGNISGLPENIKNLL